jgi:hypothetical protein
MSCFYLPRTALTCRSFEAETPQCSFPEADIHSLRSILTGQRSALRDFAAIRCARANDRCLLLASFCSSPKNECCLSLGTQSEPPILRKQAFEPQPILLVKVENQGHADTLHQLVPIPPSRLSAATQSVDTYQACGPHPN